MKTKLISRFQHGIINHITPIEVSKPLKTSLDMIKNFSGVSLELLLVCKAVTANNDAIPYIGTLQSVKTNGETRKVH